MVKLHPRWLIAATIAGLAALTGCANPSGGFGLVGGGSRPTLLTREELRDRLDQFEDSFEAQVRKASDEILERDSSRRMKRLTLIWQMRMVPMLRNTLDQDNPLGAVLDSWTLCLRMRAFLTEGDGKSLFGEQQPIAVRAATECEAEIRRIAELVLTPQMIQDTQSRVRDVATKHPLFGEFSGADVRTAIAGGDDRVLQDVLAIPLAPFRWLGGVDETAQAIKGFTAVSARLTDVVQGLAADARLQTQLLLLEVEDLDSTRSALASMERLSNSSERLSATAEKLPQELRRELTALLEKVEADQPELRKTVSEARALVDRLDPAGASVARAGDAWKGTAQAIEEMVASFRRPVGAASASAETDAGSETGIAPTNANSPLAAPSAKAGTAAAGTDTDPHSDGDVRKGPAFDINDYARTAEALTEAARELQKLTVQIRQLGESNDLTRRLDELSARVEGLVAESRAAASGVADHAVWRLGQLAVFVFGLLVVYRIVVLLSGRRAAPHGRA
ncbi:MAG: hypothetical protein DCC65_11915 [Planctomycetota bacterium]|nr:MAG: hypothetical protein DCC65_11915 [Planctomycetota bacterium]